MAHKEVLRSPSLELNGFWCRKQDGLGEGMNQRLTDVERSYPEGAFIVSSKRHVDGLVNVSSSSTTQGISTTTTTTFKPIHSEFVRASFSSGHVHGIYICSLAPALPIPRPSHFWFCQSGVRLSRYATCLLPTHTYCTDRSTERLHTTISRHITSMSNILLKT